MMLTGLCEPPKYLRHSLPKQRFSVQITTRSGSPSLPKILWLARRAKSTSLLQLPLRDHRNLQAPPPATSRSLVHCSDASRPSRPCELLSKSAAQRTCQHQLAQARKAFPGASSVMVRRMFENISVSVPLEELFENIMAADMTKLCYPSDEFLHDPHRKGKSSPNLTIRSRQLYGSMPISQMGKYPRNFCSLEVASLSNLKTGLAKPLSHLPSFPARPAVAPPARSLIHLHNRLVNCLTAQLPGHLPSCLVGRPWQL